MSAYQPAGDWNQAHLDAVWDGMGSWGARDAEESRGAARDLPAWDERDLLPERYEL